MKYDTESKIKDYADVLDKINEQRRMWLYASLIVYTGVIFLIFGWGYLEDLHNTQIWWVVISLSLLISVNWWYWTMHSISILVKSIYNEYEILQEVTTDITHVKIILACKSSTTEICNECPVVDVCIGKK